MKVLIATPMYGGMCTAGYTASLVNLIKKAGEVGVEIDLMYGVNESLITYARNMCANLFLKSNATHLLFIDSDMLFDGEQVLKMIKTEKDFICGIYPKKKIDWDKVKHFAMMGYKAEMLQSLSNEWLFEPIPNAEPDENGLVEVRRCGTGMMMIARTVFEQLSDKVDSFNLVSPVQSNIRMEQGELYKEFFITSKDPANNVFLNEDFTFCDLWRNNGGKIYGAPWVKIQHIGYHVFG